MTTMHPQVLIIGIGNEYRRDDGAGIVAARRLRAQTPPPGVAVLEQSGEGTALLEAWAQYPVVLLIDAVDSGAPSGRCFRLEPRARKLPSRWFHGSSHAFGVVEAVELARALNQLPERLVLYGIQGKDFSAGVGLSAEVEAGVAGVIRHLLGELRRRNLCPNRGVTRWLRSP